MVVPSGGGIYSSRFQSTPRGYAHARFTKRQVSDANPTSGHIDPVPSPSKNMEKFVDPPPPTAPTFNGTNTPLPSQQAPSTTPQNTSDTALVTQTKVLAVETSTESNQSSSTTDGHASRGRSTTSTTTSWTPTEDPPSSVTSSSTSSRSPILVIISTTVTEPMSSKTVMMTQIVVETSVITGDSKKNTPVIAGTVTGVVALLAISICALVYFCRLRRRKPPSARSLASTESPPLSQSSKMQAERERERERRRAASSADPDHQEATDRSVDEEDRGQLSTGRESVISSGDSDSIVGIPDPPPAYIP